STSPCTKSGCPRTRYQIDNPATAAITSPTTIDGKTLNNERSRVDDFGASLSGSGAACFCASGKRRYRRRSANRVTTTETCFPPLTGHHRGLSHHHTIQPLRGSFGVILLDNGAMVL